jgi:type II secretory pathway pseudopilin PulG
MTTDIVKLLLAHSQTDTKIHNGEDYDTIDLLGIWQLVQFPQCKEKGQSDFIIPSSYHKFDGRSHEAQRENGSFHLLAIDVDSGNPSLEEVSQAVIGVLGNAAHLIYSSSGATHENRKWRVLIPLSAPVSGKLYADYQAALFDGMAKEGIECDYALARAGQPIYLPNVPADRRDDDNHPLFYEFYAHQGERINPVGHYLEREVLRRKAHREQAEAQAAKERQRRQEERAAKRAANPQQVDPVTEFGERYTVSDMLAKYGYTQLASSDQWHSPNQSTKSYPVKDFGDHWVSLSGSDVAAGIGNKKDFYCWGDAFDLFVHYEHGGDFTAAVRAYGQEINPSKPTAQQVLKDQFEDFADHSDPEPAQEEKQQAEPEQTLMQKQRVVMMADAQPVLSSSYLIKGWLGKSQMSVIYGQSNVGKSFFCLDMAFSVAANVPWNGAKVRGGTVLYLATEGGAAFRNRLYALKQSKGISDAPLAVRASPVDLLRAEVDLQSIMELCKEVAQKYGKIEMIVVDTLSRALAGGNENGPEDMTRFIGNIDALRHLTQAHMMIVHHAGKTSNTARGHSSLRAACDTEIELELEEGIRIAKTTKQRDMEPKPPFGFTLKVHELGDDEDGDKVTTCTIEPVDDETMKEAKGKKVTGTNQNLILQCFTNLRGEGIGKPNPAGAGWPNPREFWVIPEEALKDHALGKFSDRSNPHHAYKTAVNSLIKGGHMQRNEGHLWVTSKNGKYHE